MQSGLRHSDTKPAELKLTNINAKNRQPKINIKSN